MTKFLPTGRQANDKSNPKLKFQIPPNPPLPKGGEGGLLILNFHILLTFEIIEFHFRYGGLNLSSERSYESFFNKEDYP